MAKDWTALYGMSTTSEGWLLTSGKQLRDLGACAVQVGVIVDVLAHGSHTAVIVLSPRNVLALAARGIDIYWLARNISGQGSLARYDIAALIAAKNRAFRTFEIAWRRHTLALRGLARKPKKKGARKAARKASRRG